MFLKTSKMPNLHRCGQERTNKFMTSLLIDQIQNLLQQNDKNNELKLLTLG